MYNAKITLASSQFSFIFLLKNRRWLLRIHDYLMCRTNPLTPRTLWSTCGTCPVCETKLWRKSIGSSLILVKAHVGRVRCVRRSSGGKALALLWFLLKLVWDVSGVWETKLWRKSIGSSLILVKAHVGRVRCVRRSSGGKALALLWFLLKLVWDVSCVRDEALEEKHWLFSDSC